MYTHNETERKKLFIPVGRQLKALSVSFILFHASSRVLKITNPYVHQPSL